MKSVILLSVLLSVTTTLMGQQVFPDCSQAHILCNDEPVSVEALPPVYSETPIVNSACLKGDFPTTNSTWFKWEVATPGSLGFILIPVDGEDDLDFVLFKMSNGLEDCSQKEAVRCMASGDNRGTIKGSPGPECSGVTGLSNTSSDINESKGCAASSDNFLAEIDVQQGEVYALFVNNYYSADGFLLEFTGSAILAPITGLCDNQNGNTSESVDLSGIQDEGLYVEPVYPNPSRSEITLPVISGKLYSYGEWQIVGLHGDILDRNSLSITEGLNDVNINISSIPAGVYFLKIQLGENIHITRFSKF